MNAVRKVTEVESPAILKARELNGIMMIPAIQWTRVGYKQAWTSNVLQKRYILIKSYQTIVGIVDLQDEEFFEIGKYSPTTSKQVTQIYNSMFRNCNRNFVNGRV